MERRKYHRSRGLHRPHTHAGRNTAEDERKQLYGIPEREKQPDDLRKVGEHEVQVPQQRVLVQRLL